MTTPTPEEHPMSLPTCPREDCTASIDHWHDGGSGGWMRAVACHPPCGHNGQYRCYAPRTPQPKPTSVVLPTVEECRTAIREAWAAENAIGSGPRIAAQAVLDLIAARLPVWQPVEPGTVIKAGTRVREVWPDGDATEWTAAADFPRSPSTSHVFIDPRTVPAEPEDPALAVVREWLKVCGPIDAGADDARVLLARIDAARADS